ncbi:MAG: DUF4446 family protein [bacterium]|nr:DUF4446 family protein [bacterium]
MNIFENLGINTDYVLLGLLGFVFILFILVIVLFVKNSKLNKRYRAFMQGSEAKSLEESIQTRFSEVDMIKELLKKHQNHLDQLEETFKVTYQKMGIVRYDAFKEMGGKLSFALALLNDDNSGFIINSMHSSREGCYTYVKEIIHGEAFVVLAEEEVQALDQAMKSKDLIKE